MIEAASTGPHTALYEAVATRRDGRVVFRLVADSDRMAKAAAPPDPADVLDRMVAQLAGQLRRETAAWSAPRIREYLRALDVELGSASAAEVNRAFARADAVMRRASIETLARPWVARVEAHAKLIAGETRAWIRAVHLPRINLAFGQPDREAIRQVAAQQGWFLRDAHFRISDTMTAQGRKIVESGLRDGLGTDAVARRLRAEIPDLYVRRAGNYALACASVGMQRARSWSMAASYSDAGIEYYQITAVLDERTTDCCRYLDGQIISVGDAQAAMARANAITNPEDIYQESPFVRTVRDGDRRYLRTGRGDILAEVKQSGVGTRVDAQNRAPVGTHNGGVYGGRVAGNQLVDKGIGFPPFHHLCRSTTVPVLGPVQVPRGYTPVAVPGPPIRPPTPPAVPPPGPGAYAIPPRLDRPVVAVPSPRRGTPAPFGSMPQEGADPYMRPGLLDGIALDEQVRQRVRDAVLVLNEGVLAARATRAGRALRKPKLGAVLREGLAVEARRRAPDPARWVLSRRTGLQGQLAERKARELYAEPLSWLSPRFAGRVPTLPPLVTDHGPLGWTGDAIRLPRGTNAVQGRFLHRAVAEWLDGIGSNGAAGALARDDWRIGGGPLFTLPDGARVERGRWGDVLTGARWPGQPDRALVSGVAMHAVSPRMATKLATLWEANPAHVGFLLAWLQGAFL